MVSRQVYDDLYVGPPTGNVVDGNRLLDLISVCIHRATAAWHRQGNSEYIRSFPDWTKAVSTEYPLDLCYWIEKLNYHNYIMWHYEDYAATDKLMFQDGKFYPAVHWAALNRAQHQTGREEAVWEIDNILVLREQTNCGARYSPATVGQLLDRICIIRLKLHHMLERDDCVQELDQLNRLFAEYSFLEVEAALLVNALRDGTKRIQPFRPLRVRGIVA